MTILAQTRQSRWAAAGIASLVAAGLAVPGTTFLLDEIGKTFSFIVLGAWLIVLYFIGRVFRPALPVYLALATVAAFWSLQRVFFLRMLPGKFLEYGFFLRPQGKAARLWVLEFPFAAGVVVLVFTFAWALIVTWRQGYRWSLLALFSWWLATFMVFSLPSIYLYLQGDAAIFI